MAINIIPTKLFPPMVVRRLVPRLHLQKYLQTGISGPVTIVTAPPGFGKTTLISGLPGLEEQRKVAWFSLDEEDNEPVFFFSYIAAALQKVFPGSFQPFDELLNSLPVDPNNLVRGIIRGWMDHPHTGHTVLILDDYHHITSQAIHEAVAYWIDHMPPDLHLVLIGRVDPPLPLGRWRARGWLTEIRAEDLRFDETEAAQFLRDTMEISISDHDIHVLETRTEGWVAGLQLAALFLQKTVNPQERVREFAGSHRYIAEYLTGEVLSQQPDDVRDFLLKTSLLDRFCAPLCDYILETPGKSARMLQRIEQANLFLVPLDANGTWFRYHHLFADLLRRRLEQREGEQIAVLYARAGEWFEQNQLRLEAIQYWIASNRIERIAASLDRALRETWGRAELPALMRRIESIPRAVLVRYPALCAFLGWSWLWLGYDIERIRPLMDEAEQNLPETGSAETLGRMNVIRSSLARVLRNDLPETIHLANLALEQLAPGDTLWRGFAQMGIAIARHSLGNLEEADAAYADTVRLCSESGDQASALIAACAQGEVTIERGNLSRAASMTRALLEPAGEASHSSLIRGWAHMIQARLDYQVNRLAEAERQVTLAAELENQTGGLPDVSLRRYALLAQLCLATGDAGAARGAAEQMLALAKRGGVTNAIDWAQAVHALLMYRVQDCSAFNEWAQSYRPSEQPLFFPYRLATLLYARSLIQQSRFQEANRLLESQLSLAVQGGLVEYEMELQIVRALAGKASNKPEQVTQAAQCALELGMQGGYVRIFLDEGSQMIDILRQVQKALLAEPLRQYCARLLAGFDQKTGGLPRTSTTAGLVEPLTRREVEILQLIAQGMSNPEIAKKLFLSAGTVKVHVKHIYGKLDVDDRVKAASKARELGLLS